MAAAPPFAPRADGIVLILSAMRHFAAELTARGLQVDYVRLDDPDNTQSFRGEMARAVARHAASGVVVTEPGEWRVLDDMRSWHEAAGCPVDIREDDRFLCSIREFRDWAAGKRSLRMEFFYRDMRRRHALLLDAGEGPEGGRWNFDAENRKRLPRGGGWRCRTCAAWRCSPTAALWAPSRMRRRAPTSTG